MTPTPKGSLMSPNPEMKDHLGVLAQRLGQDMVRTMQSILDLPEEVRIGASSFTEIKTVDGHVWSISVEYDGFEGPDAPFAPKEPSPHG